MMQFYRITWADGPVGYNEHSMAVLAESWGAARDAAVEYINALPNADRCSDPEIGRPQAELEPHMVDFIIVA